MMSRPPIFDCKLFVLVFTSCLVGTAGFGSSIKPLDSYLTSLHIRLDQRSLIEAVLTGSDDVKVAASTYLAEKGIKSSIPAIRTALYEVKDLNLAIQLARALAVLKDADGSHFLANVCQDTTASDVVRVRASILEEGALKESECTAALTSLANSGDRSAKIEALSFFPMLTSKEVNREELISIARRNVSDPDSEVRRASFSALVEMKAPNIEADLRTAADSEANSFTRSALYDLIESVKKSEGTRTQR